ncbi:MAG: hypothetical protein ACPGUV_07855 [Polyangiales bacterium]
MATPEGAGVQSKVAEPTLSYTLLDWLEDKGTTHETVSGLLEALAEQGFGELFHTYAPVIASMAANQVLVDGAHPRVVLANEAATRVLAFYTQGVRSEPGGGGADRSANNVIEVIEWQGVEQGWALGELKASLGTLAFRRNPPHCRKCHGEPAHPVINAFFPNWPGWVGHFRAFAPEEDVQPLAGADPDTVEFMRGGYQSAAWIKARVERLFPDNVAALDRDAQPDAAALALHLRRRTPEGQPGETGASWLRQQAESLYQFSHSNNVQSQLLNFDLALRMLQHAYNRRRCPDKLCSSVAQLRHALRDVDVPRTNIEYVWARYRQSVLDPLAALHQTRLSDVDPVSLILDVVPPDSLVEAAHMHAYIEAKSAPHCGDAEYQSSFVWRLSLEGDKRLDLRQDLIQPPVARVRGRAVQVHMDWRCMATVRYDAGAGRWLCPSTAQR